MEAEPFHSFLRPRLFGWHQISWKINQ